MCFFSVQNRNKQEKSSSFPARSRGHEKSKNESCVLTFLTILSQVPDTLISRKYGNDEALKISMMTRDLLKMRDSPDFDERLKEFDDYLYKNKYNPGTTADLTAASIFVSYLKSNF